MAKAIFQNSKEETLFLRRAFSTDDGKTILRWLEQKFEKPSLVPMQAHDGQGMTNITFMRIGEQNVVKTIKQTIEREFTND